MADFDIVEPSASALFESIRAFGYTPETAIADLIDNSIFAGAKNVWLDFHWNGRDSYVTIRDDGCGMVESSLVSAMRPGSAHPMAERETKDLGRFGLGLKTASISQCRRLTVASKAATTLISVRRWDLDYIASIANNASDSGWRLLRDAAPGSESRFQSLAELKTGTIVLWEVLDRIVGDVDVNDSRAQDRFLINIKRIEEHIAMVFHRFLEGPRPRVNIYINGSKEEHRISPWDPFLRSHSATWSTPLEPISLGDHKISVQGFVLPHKDKLAAEVLDIASGPKGWNAQQGFYVYRNERLLVAGNWLGLGSPRSWAQEEHYKLARILVDIPNTTDGEWQIDVKKSTARPPAIVRSRLERLADSVRKRARKVFAHRGSYNARGSDVELEQIWKSFTIDGRRSYRIDRNHALLRDLKIHVNESEKDLEILLRLIEETVPVQQIWLDAAELPDKHSRPFETAVEADVVEVMTHFYRALLRVEGLQPSDAVRKIAALELFREYQHLLHLLNKTAE